MCLFAMLIVCRHDYGRVGDLVSASPITRFELLHSQQETYMLLMSIKQGNHQRQSQSHWLRVFYTHPGCNTYAKERRTH